MKSIVIEVEPLYNDAKVEDYVDGKEYLATLFSNLTPALQKDTLKFFRLKHPCQPDETIKEYIVRINERDSAIIVEASDDDLRMQCLSCATNDAKPKSTADNSDFKKMIEDLQARTTNLEAENRTIIAENRTLRVKVMNLESRVVDLEAETRTLQEKFDNLQAKFEDYKKKTGPLLEWSVAVGRVTFLGDLALRIANDLLQHGKAKSSMKKEIAKLRVAIQCLMLKGSSILSLQSDWSKHNSLKGAKTLIGSRDSQP